jgi:hypothetical protein
MAGAEEVERQCKWGRRSLSDLERGHHLAFFLTVYEIIVVLHRYEGREAIIDRVICSAGKRSMYERAGALFFTVVKIRVGAHFASDGLVKEERKKGVGLAMSDERVEVMGAYIARPSMNSCQCNGPNPSG